MDPNIPVQPAQNETQVTQPNLQQTVNKSPSPRGKWKLISLIIIILVVVGGGAYFLIENKILLFQNQQKTIIQTSTKSSPTSAPISTADWKTYTNSQYGFSIKYPKSWTYDVSSGVNTIIDFSGPSSNSHTSIELHIVDPGFISAYYVNIDDAVNQLKNLHDVRASRSVKKSNIGLLSVAEVHSIYMHDEFWDIDLYSRDIAFAMLSEEGMKNYQNLPLMYQMLSTFKFASGEVIVPVPTPSQETLNAITIVPQHADQFKKTIIINGDCTFTFGLVTYQDKVSDSLMMIDSLTLSDRIPAEPGEENKDGLLKISSFLDKNTSTTYQDFYLGFAQGECTGDILYYLKELPNISYPNTDKSRTIMVFADNGSALGAVKIIVLAKKGDNFIYLEKALDSSNLTADDNSCDFRGAENNCYEKTLANDKSLEATSIEEAKKLIALFSIKN
jgi:hypothetical protein